MTKSINSDFNQNHLLVPKVWVWTFEDNLSIVCFHLLLIFRWMRLSNQGALNIQLVTRLIWNLSITIRMVWLDVYCSIWFDHWDIVTSKGIHQDTYSSGRFRSHPKIRLVFFHGKRDQDLIEHPQIAFEQSLQLFGHPMLLG